jgi:hypothetical protein
MNEENKTNRKERLESVALTKSSSEKINRWLEQILGKRVRLSRKEFLNWFIEKSPDTLSNSDLNSIVKRYYDDEAYLRQVLREMKQAKKEGHPGQMEVVVRPRKTEAKRENVSPNDQMVEKV